MTGWNTNLSDAQFYHGTDAKLRRGDMIQPSVANESDYREDPDNDDELLPDPSAYASTRVNTAARYGYNVYKVKPTGPVNPDWSMVPQAESYKSRQPMQVQKKWAYRPPPEHGIDAVSLRNNF
jgi:hypothetical protein